MLVVAQYRRPRLRRRVPVRPQGADRRDLGGIGSVGGALIGGFAIGLFETLWSAVPADRGAGHRTLRGAGRLPGLPARRLLRHAGPEPATGVSSPHASRRPLGPPRAPRAPTPSASPTWSAPRATIAGQVLRTPLVPAPRLSELTGASVLVKHENMQPTGSFKERGAVTKLEGLSADERRRGVIAMSAGNHAQAVAYHARRLGIPATIVMPLATPW